MRKKEEKKEREREREETLFISRNLRFPASGEYLCSPSPDLSLESPWWLWIALGRKKEGGKGEKEILPF